VFLHGNISVDNCARELFKLSKDLGSLQASNEKKFFGFGFIFFVSDVISKVGFWPFSAADT